MRYHLLREGVDYAAWERGLWYSIPVTQESVTVIMGVIAFVPLVSQVQSGVK